MKFILVESIDDKKERPQSENEDRQEDNTNKATDPSQSVNKKDDNPKNGVTDNSTDANKKDDIESIIIDTKKNTNAKFIEI